MKNSLFGWTPKLTRRLKELALLMQHLVHQWWMGHLKNHCQAQARPHQASRQLTHLVGHQLNAWIVPRQLRTCENGCERYEHQCGTRKHECGAVYLREKRLNVDTWKKRHCWAHDDVTWRAQSTHPCQRPWPDAPTESERTVHELTRLPPWRATCTPRRGLEAHHGHGLRRGKGPSRRKRSRWRSGDVSDNRRLKYGYMRARQRRKEPQSTFARSVADFVNNLFVGKFMLRCDNEPSITAVAEKVKVKMPDRVEVENRDTASNGFAERAIRHAEALQDAKITPEPAMWPWTVRNAGFLCHEIRTWSGWQHTVQSSV